MKNFRKLAIIPVLAFLLIPLVVPLSASAAPDATQFTNSLESVGNSAYGGDVSSAPSLPEMIGQLINVALGLLGMVLLVLVIYGGYLWMTAGGNSEQVDKAKKIITNAVVGLVIIMASYAIANFVFGAVLNSTIAG